ncbi:hypothetical protein AAZX31_16G150300 [Glycine max]
MAEQYWCGDTVWVWWLENKHGRIVRISVTMSDSFVFNKLMDGNSLLRHKRGI